MPPEHVYGRLDGVRGIRLYWQGWLPPGPPTGVLLICHGLGEHSGRYRTVIDTLLPDGWACYGVDLRGHGRSAGRRAHVDDYRDWLDDLERFRRLVVDRHPAHRPFLLGHTRRLAATCGSPDLTVRWYESLWHEIYHEPERALPLADLRGWLAARR